MRKSAQGPSAASRDARRRAHEARVARASTRSPSARRASRRGPPPPPRAAPTPSRCGHPRGARPDRAPPTVATTVGATTPDGIENPPEPAPRADPPADPREPSPASPPSTPASLVATLANALADLERELIALAAPEPKRRSSSPGGIDEDGAGRAESDAEDAARASVRDAARRASDLCADLGLADAAKRLEQPPSPDSVHQLDASFDSEDGEGWREKTTNDARLGAEEEEEEDASADDARAREEDAPAGFPAASKASLALDFDAAADDAPAVATYLSSDDAGSIIGEDRVEDRFEDRFGDRRSDGFGRRAARVVRFSDCSLWAVHDIGSVRDLRREKRGGLVGAVAGWVKAETRALVSSLKGSGGAGEEEEAFKASIRRALRLGRRNMLENVDYNAAFSETADRRRVRAGGGTGGRIIFREVLPIVVYYSTTPGGK